MMFFILVALSLILSFMILVKKIMKNLQPPGPLGLPIIGNLHQFDSSTPHIYFWRLSKKYGKIFSLKVGSATIIVVSSAKLAKEVTKTQDLAFCSRPSLRGQQKLSYDGHDIAFSPYNEYWREIRKICVLQLFSVKKVQSFTHARKDEVFRMIKKISQQASTCRVTNLSNLAISLSSTIICRVAFGIRFDEEAHERKRFDQLLAETQAMMVGFFFTDYLPFLGWLDKLLGNITRLEKNYKDLDEFYEEVIKQHVDPNRPKSMDGDILDVLLELKKEQAAPIDLTLDNIKAILMNVLVGGTETSAGAVVWAMTALIKNPKAMRKVQAEIRNIVAKKDIVDEGDVQNLPYFKAVIKEAFRLYPSVPLLVAREALKKTTLEGYEIKPKSIIHVNSWAIARDPELWENPEEFLPERFLNSNIDYKGQDFEFIPFGAGRRGCPGIALGVATLELALSNLLFAFDWELPYGMKAEDIDMDVLPGLTMRKKNALCLVAKKYM